MRLLTQDLHLVLEKPSHRLSVLDKNGTNYFMLLYFDEKKTNRRAKERQAFYERFSSDLSQSVDVTFPATLILCKDVDQSGC